MVEGDHIEVKRKTGDFLRLYAFYLTHAVGWIDDVIADTEFKCALAHGQSFFTIPHDRRRADAGRRDHYAKGLQRADSEAPAKSRDFNPCASGVPKRPMQGSGARLDRTADCDVGRAGRNAPPHPVEQGHITKTSPLKGLGNDGE
jgi:hypothetical protein